MNKVLTISIYGKYSPEDFEDMYRELGLLMWSRKPEDSKSLKSTSKSTTRPKGSQDDTKLGPNIYEATKKHLLNPDKFEEDQDIPSDTIITSRKLHT